MPDPAPVSFPAASVIVVGSYVQDHVWQTDRFPQPGETRRALGFSTGPGGKGFNQAIACLRQGGEVVFVGATGNDAIGANARALALDEGLACTWLVLDRVPTATAGIVVDAAGANQIMVNLAANENLSVDFLHAQSRQFSVARVLLVQLENNLDAVHAALEIGVAHDLLCVLNPAPMHAALDLELLSKCDVVTPNETEFAQLIARVSGEPLDGATLSAMGDGELHALCRMLGVATVVVTLGASGCFVSHHADLQRGDVEQYYRIAAEKVDAIDTTGAGDSFSGALVAMLARTEVPSFRECVSHANRVAAMSTERIGAAVAIPHLDEVIARFGARDKLRDQA